MRRVHREAMEYVVFIGSQLAWMEQPKQGLAYHRTEETGILFDHVWSKQGPVHREGSGISQNGGNGLVFDRVRAKRGPVDREGCGVSQNGGNTLVLECLWSKRGPVHQEGCCIPQISTPRPSVHPPSSSPSLHLLLFIQRRLLQPPLAIVHPRALQQNRL